MGIIAVSKDGQLLTVLRQKRNYPVAQMPTTEAAIDYGCLVIEVCFRRSTV